MLNDKELLELARKHESILIEIDGGRMVPIASTPEAFMVDMNADPEDDGPTTTFIKHIFLAIKTSSPYGGGQAEFLRECRRLKWPVIPEDHEKEIYRLCQLRHKNGKPYLDTWVAEQMNNRGFIRPNGKKYDRETISNIKDKLFHCTTVQDTA